MNVDIVTARVVLALQAANVKCILLKGPSFARWLYDKPSDRIYVDTDVLVRAEVVGEAQEVLTQLGFSPPVVDEDFFEEGWKVQEWRNDSGAGVDLHRTLVGVDLPQQEVWPELIIHTEPIEVAGVETLSLDAPGRLMHVALHAGQHGARFEQPLLDLELALERMDQEIWAEAARLAARLEATSAFAAGLRSIPAGEAMANHLGLPLPHTVDSLLRSKGSTDQVIGFARALEWLLGPDPIHRKIKKVARELFPSTSFMRKWSPAASKGRLFLALSYVHRLLWIAKQALPAIKELRQARDVAGDRKNRE